MIKSKQDYEYYLEADRIAKSIPKNLLLANKIKNILFPNHVWKFQQTLRKLEYYENCKKGILFYLTRFFIVRRFKRLSKPINLDFQYQQMCLAQDYLLHTMEQ